MENLSNGLCLLVMRRLIMAMVLMAVAVSAQAKYYKWVDESGQVHYSESPPPELKRDQVQRLEIKTDTSDQPATVTPKEEAVRCGSIMLPKKLPSPAARVTQLKQAKATWQKYLDENSGSTDEAIRRRMADRRCAIEHADRELQSLSDVESDMENNLQRVNDELEELQQRVAECNELTPEEGEPSVAECRSQHEKRISELKQIKRSLEIPSRQ